MKDVIKFISTRKGVIVAIVLTIAGYLAAKGMIGENEMVLIGSIVGIISGGASLTKYKANGK